MSEPKQIPSPLESDSNEVRWALETASSLWANDAREALRWLRRAAESASDGGDDLRSVQLASAAADLRNSASVVGSLPPAASAPPPAMPNSSAPVASPAAIKAAAAEAAVVDPADGVPTSLDTPAAQAQALVAEQAVPVTAATPVAVAPVAAVAVAPVAAVAVAPVAAVAVAPVAAAPAVVVAPAAAEAPAVTEAAAASVASQSGGALAEQQAEAASLGALKGLSATATPLGVGQAAPDSAVPSAPANVLAATDPAATLPESPASIGSSGVHLSPEPVSVPQPAAEPVAASVPEPVATSVPEPVAASVPEPVAASVPAAAVDSTSGPLSEPPTSGRFVSHHAVRVAISKVPAPNGLFQLHPLAEGEGLPDEWAEALLVGLDTARLFPGKS